MRAVGQAGEERRDPISRGYRISRVQYGVNSLMGHRIGFGGRVRIGHGMGPGLIRIVGAFGVVKVQTDFAVAAVAACTAFFAQMVGARILRALHANTGGFFFADTADKGHGCNH